MNNLTKPIYNKIDVVKQGNTIILAPTDFDQYDELWAHVRVQGVTGSPTSGTLKATWQIEHPQDGGSTHDANPTFIDLNVFNNGHLLHGGLDWPMLLASTVPETFTPYAEYIRGIKLQTPRIRLKFTANFSGGTDPAYIVSVSYHMKRASSESRPMFNVQADGGSAGHSKIRDVWGYTILNKDAAAPCTIEFRNDYTITNGALKTVEAVPAGGSVSHMFERPIRFGSGLYVNFASVGAGGASVLIYTSDNLSV